jgi:hypothetical protein
VLERVCVCVCVCLCVWHVASCTYVLKAKLVPCAREACRSRTWNAVVILMLASARKRVRVRWCTCIYMYVRDG